MAQTTKLELSQLLAARNKELEAARLRIAELEGDVVALKTKLAVVPATQAPRPAYQVPAPSCAQIAFRVRLAAARELAMRTGQSVVA